MVFGCLRVVPDGARKNDCRHEFMLSAKPCSTLKKLLRKDRRVSTYGYSYQRRMRPPFENRRCLPVKIGCELRNITSASRLRQQNLRCTLLIDI